MYCGLCSKLHERQPPVVEAVQQAGLVLADRKRDYVAKHFGEMTSSSVRPDGDATAATHAGYLAGRATELRPAVEGATEGRLLG